MFKKIIVPLDPTKRLGAAREYGLALAQRFGATPVGVYIIAPVKTGFGAMPVDRDMFMVPAGERALESFKAEAEERGLRAEGHIAHGYREEALARAIGEGRGDTLVLGSFRSQLTRLFTGSEDERIVDLCPCPLFVARHRAPLPEPGQTLLVPFDGGAINADDEAAVEAVANHFQAKVELIHYTMKKHRTQDKELDQSQATFPTRLLAGGQSVHHGHYQPMVPLIQQAAGVAKAPLIVVPLLHGSNAVSYRLLHDLILHQQIPLCLLRGESEAYRQTGGREAE